jgi:predicted nucleic acid-binding protein
MTGTLLYLDTSALLRRYVSAPDRGLVVDAMEAAGSWAASMLSRTEILLALHELAVSPDRLSDLWALVRGEWDAMWTIPLDQRSLSAAVDIGGRFGLGTIDALQLGCASRLPRPAAFCTFERQQIPAAVELGFEVISPFA